MNSRPNPLTCTDDELFELLVRRTMHGTLMRAGGEIAVAGRLFRDDETGRQQANELSIEIDMGEHDHEIWAECPDYNPRVV